MPDAGVAGRHLVGVLEDVALDRDYFQEVFDPAQVFRIGGVEPSTVRMRGGRYQEIHHPWSRLPADLDDSGSQLTVTTRDTFVHR